MRRKAKGHGETGSGEIKWTEEELILEEKARPYYCKSPEELEDTMAEVTSYAPRWDETQKTHFLLGLDMPLYEDTTWLVNVFNQGKWGKRKISRAGVCRAALRLMIEAARKFLPISRGEEGKYLVDRLMPLLPFLPPDAAKRLRDALYP